MATPRAINPLYNVVREMQGAIVVGSANMLATAIRRSTRELPSVLIGLGRALELNKMPRSRMAQTNQRIAEKAQRAVVTGWRSTLQANSPPGIPREKRLSGKLGPALADPANTAGTTDRVISFADTGLLSREAAHWYRVNYGARGTNASLGRAPRRFVMQLDGKAFGSFRDDLPADPVSWIPKRVYWELGEMYPASHDVVRSKTGARAARFLDLGHAVVAREAPKAYDKLWREYLQEKGGQAAQRLKKVDINVVGDLRLQRTSWTARVRT